MTAVTTARNLDDALAVLARLGASVRCLAGGTDLMVELHAGRPTPDHVLDLWRVDALRGITLVDRGLRLGALTTAHDLVHAPLVARHADLLAAAARDVGAEQIRHRATLGGNLGTASPAADLLPPLLALDAMVVLRSLRGVRQVPAAAFVTGYRTTARAADELIEAVWIPARPADEWRAFRKVGTRRAQSIAKVVVALAVRAAGGMVHSVRAAAGSVAERTVLLPTLDRLLAGRRVDAAACHAAARLCARDDVRPIDDVRSTARYRRHALARVLEHLLLSLCLPSA